MTQLALILLDEVQPNFLHQFSDYPCQNAVKLHYYYSKCVNLAQGHKVGTLSWAQLHQRLLNTKQALCFTRPEMKVKRISYDIMTPSAARGMIESIYWHSGIRRVVDRIHVLAPIRIINLQRNEVKSTVSACSARTAMERGQGELYLATSQDIQQRASLLLRDVRYVIEAHFEKLYQ